MKKIIAIALFLFLTSFGFTYAQSKLQNPLKVDSIEAVILLVVDIMVYVGVSFAILAMIFVGFKFVTAQGKPDEITKAKEWFMWIIIGLAVLISAKVIVEIVKNTLVNSGVVNEGFLNGSDMRSAPIRKGDNIDASYSSGIES